MALRRQPIVHTGQPAVDRALDSVKAVLDEYSSKDLLDHVHLTEVALIDGSNQIAHKLGRQPIGWIVTDRTAATEIYRESWGTSYITLNSDDEVTINLMVY